MAEKRFGSDTFRVQKLDAEGAMRLLLRTTKMFGPASKVLSALGETDKAKAESMSVAAIAEFVGKLDEDEAISYVRDLISMCQCNGQPAVFGVDPQELGDVFQVAWWVLEVQFKDFLGGSTVKPLVRRAMAQG
jgi:hypothetical protein